ncbi:MAG: DNA polymerase [Candidatus Bathyarchaeia archaeon]
MLDRDINQLVDCYTQVLAPKRMLGEITNPTITIQQLISHIKTFCNENSIRVGKTVYVLCHFAQAELQHIEDLWKNLKVRVYLKSMYAEYHGELHLIVVDTFAHFMCGLDKVAKTVGMEKMSLEGVGGESEKYWKENMRQLLREHPDIFEKYAKRDSEVLIKAFTERRKFFLDRFGLDTLRMVTLAQTAQQIFTASGNFLTETAEPYTVEWASHKAKSRRSSAKESATTTKIDEWVTQWHRVKTYCGSRDKRYFAMKCYWGGRREAFTRGFLDEPVEIWDVKQMYPSMARLPLPNQYTKWSYLEPNSNSMQKPIEGSISIGNFFSQKYVGFVNCKFRFPVGFDYPCLPVFDSRFPKLIFPLEGETWCTTYEVDLAHRLGGEISDVKAWVFQPTETEWNNPLKRYMEHFTKMKNSNPEGSMPYENAKLLMNSLIGKFCQRDNEYSIETYQNILESLGYDYDRFRDVLRNVEQRQKYKNPINVGSCWEPEWSALILGSARATISEIMHTTKALTGHTDSVIIQKGSPTQCKAIDLLHSLGSDLEHKKAYDADGFWICRSAVYSPIRDGTPIKPTHHGYPCDNHEDFGKIIMANLAEGIGVQNQTRKVHLTTAKEALRQQIKLNTQATKTTRITWDWDLKRVLRNPQVNIWRDWSQTTPWQSLQTLLNSLPSHYRGTAKTTRQRQISYGKALGIRMAGLAWSQRQVARTYVVSPDTVGRIVKGVR